MSQIEKFSEAAFRVVVSVYAEHWGFKSINRSSLDILCSVLRHCSTFFFLFREPPAAPTLLHLQIWSSWEEQYRVYLTKQDEIKVLSPMSSLPSGS
jgi:hypothetical protein